MNNYIYQDKAKWWLFRSLASY